MKTKIQIGAVADNQRLTNIMLNPRPWRIKTILSTRLRLLNIASLCEQIIYKLAQRLAVWMQRTLAPLRRIVARELLVLEYDRISTDRPQSFIIQDHLDCGHIEACLSWDIFDLLNAYTDNPQVRAKRHRCKPCAQLLADRKPVQPVRVAKAGTAKKQSPQFSWRMA